MVYLGTIAKLCRRAIALMKICSKGGGNLVKCLKACKEIENEVDNMKE